MAIKHGLCNSAEYNAWRSMRQRCRDAHNISYNNYGGRGITVCERWQGPQGFKNFLEDIGPRPVGQIGNKALYSLDRINNDGNYEPSNCKWATKSEQQFNQRPTRAIQNFTDGELTAELFRRQPEYGLSAC